MQKAFETYGTLRAAKGIQPKNQRRSSKLTRKKLQLQHDWNDWQCAEWKQLDQYENHLHSVNHAYYHQVQMY